MKIFKAKLQQIIKEEVSHLREEVSTTRIVPRTAGAQKKEIADYAQHTGLGAANFPADMTEKEIEDAGAAAREKLGQPKGADYAWASGIIDKEVTPNNPPTPKEIKGVREPLALADIARLTNTIQPTSDVYAPPGAAARAKLAFKTEPGIVARRAEEEAKDFIKHTYGVDRDFLDDPTLTRSRRDGLRRAWIVAAEQIYNIYMADAPSMQTKKVRTSPPKKVRTLLPPDIQKDIQKSVGAFVASTMPDRTPASPGSPKLQAPSKEIAATKFVPRHIAKKRRN